MGDGTPLNIKNAEAYRLASEIAEHTGKSLTRVVLDALRAEKERVVPAKPDRAKLRRILRQSHALPDLDSRTSAQILAGLYGERGLWK
jgi:antitoxin VapB